MNTKIYKKALFVLMIGLIASMSLMAAGQQDVADSEGPIVVHTAMSTPNNAVFAEGEDVNDNLWTRLFLEEYNVQVVFDFLSDDYATSINLAIASNKIPDVFEVNSVQFAQLVEADMLEDLTEAYDENASDYLRSHMGGVNENIFESAVVDGKLLAIPQMHFGYETQTSFVWLRNDWAEEQGITELNTIEDLENTMDLFKSEYGAETGMMLDGKNLNTFFLLAPAFHAYPKLWVEGPKGDIVYGATLPETKQALAQYAEWYSEGYIRSDFATLDDSNSREDAFNGKSGVYPWYQWAGWIMGADMIRTQGDNTYVIPFDLPSVDGEKVLYPINFLNEAYSVVRKGYKNPEVLVKLINTYMNVMDKAVVEGSMTLEEASPFASNNMHWITGPFRMSTPGDHKGVQEALATGVKNFNSGTGYTFYDECRRWLDDGDLNALGRYLQNSNDPKGSAVLASDQIANGQLIFNKIWGPTPQALLDIGSTLDDLLIEGYVKIITGSEPISYYETLINNWKKAGGDTATAAVNAEYGNQ